MLDVGLYYENSFSFRPAFKLLQPSRTASFSYWSIAGNVAVAYSRYCFPIFISQSLLNAKISMFSFFLSRHSRHFYDFYEAFVVIYSINTQ